MPAANPPAALDAPAWFAQFLADAKAALRKQESPRFDVDIYLEASLALSTVSTDNPELAPHFVTRKLDAAFFGGIVLARDALIASKAKVPPDRRRVQVLTTDDLKVTERAGNSLAGMRLAVFDAAPASDKQAAKGFGRGLPLHKRVPQSVADGLQVFLLAAKTRADLLARAGLGAADLAALEAHKTAVAAILDGKGVRKRNNKKLGKDLMLGCLTLQAAFDFYRGRARVAVDNDPELVRVALSVLPRSPERRKAAAVVAEPAPAPTAPLGAMRREAAAATAEQLV